MLPDGGRISHEPATLKLRPLAENVDGLREGAEARVSDGDPGAEQVGAWMARHSPTTELVGGTNLPEVSELRSLNLGHLDEPDSGRMRTRPELSHDAERTWTLRIPCQHPARPQYEIRVEMTNDGLFQLRSPEVLHRR